MKKLIILFIALLLFSSTAHATLITRGTGTSTHGTYNLIYDTDLDITWYDYSNAGDTWDDQVAWAEGLSVNFGGTIFDDWRLPTTVDGQWVSGFDGTTTAGYNITSSEMGHLFYTELGNLAYTDTFGTYVGDGNWGLNNTGDFQNLVSSVYWSGTEYATDTIYSWVAWGINFSLGAQGTLSNPNGYYGLAVRSGDVTATNPVPEPATIALLGIGLAGLAMAEVRRRRKREKAT